MNCHETVKMGVPPGNRKDSNPKAYVTVRRRVRGPRTSGRMPTSAIAVGHLPNMRVKNPSSTDRTGDKTNTATDVTLYCCFEHGVISLSLFH